MGFRKINKVKCNFLVHLDKLTVNTLIMLFRYRYLIISSILHIILGLFLYQKNKSAPQLPKETIQFEIRQKTISQSNLGRTGKGAKNSLNPSSKSGLKFKGSERFFPKYNFDPSGLRVNGDTYTNRPGTDDPHAEWGSGSSSFGRIKDFAFYKKLYQQVDNSLYYPSVLARKSITGTVNARLVFNQNGNCDWHLTQIRGTEPYLSLFVLSTLKNVCKMNFKPYLADRKITNADLSFHFEITESNDWERVEKERIIVGNTLLFYRNSHQSIAQWELGPFKGMFPIPMIYLNIPWLQENWERLKDNKDPLTEFRKEFGAS